MEARRDVALPGEELVKQGAEALAFRSHFLPGLPCLRKHRPRKAYRHPVLDAKLTRHRILSEARVLQKCLRAGVSVPKLYFCDVARGDLYMEFLPGRSVHAFLSSLSSPVLQAPDGQERAGPGPHVSEEKDKITDPREKEGRTAMEAIGEAIAAMHAQDIIHGDLTTSNLILSPTGAIHLIDFGLGSPSGGIEEKAVDLYVLERAFLSTHPAFPHYPVILERYARAGPAARLVLKRLETVRLRGRKRTMVG